MEIFLNFAWLTLALFLVCLWFGSPNRRQGQRRRQIIALALLVAVLFPVISVSDDLMAVQSATEVDNCQRRDHLVSSDAHPVVPLISFVSQLLVADAAFHFLHFISPGDLPMNAPHQPERSAIQNRPPPAA